MQPPDRFGYLTDVDVSTWSQATHERNMHLAIRTARRGFDLGGVLAGAVVVDSSCRLIGEGHSLASQPCDSVAHAEIVAIRSAVVRAGRHHLSDMVLYTTFELCSMCFGACAWANLGGVVYGTERSTLPSHY